MAGIGINYEIDTDNYIQWILESNHSQEDLQQWVSRNRKNGQKESFILTVINKWEKRNEIIRKMAD